MMWETINITDKIHYLKKMMGNTVEGNFDDGDTLIVNALITGSLNPMADGDYGFKVKPHHLKFMRKLWDVAIENQLDNSVILSILRGKS